MPRRTRPLRPGRPLRSRVAAGVVAVVLLGGGALVSAAPASAHDALEASDPAAGATIADLPPQLTLTFTGELLTDPGATELQVTDASGTSLTAGAPVVSGTVVTQALAPQPAGWSGGAVSVLWRVVSSDGHPIADQFVFTVEAAPAPAPTSTATALPTPTASSSVAPIPTPTSSPAPRPADPAGSSALPWIILAVVLVAAGAAVLFLLVTRARRRRAAEGSANGPGTGSDTSPGR